LLKRRGIEFNSSFANNPLCAPSRASLLTGQATHNHGIWTNDTQAGGGYTAFKPRAGNSLGPWLKDRSYATAFIGKFLNGYGPTDGVPPGWDKWSVWTKDKDHNVFFGYTLNEDGVLHTYGHAPEDYETDVFARQAVDFIGAATSPFFLEVATNAPHAPAIPAPRDAGAYATAPLPTPSNFNEANINDKPMPMRALPLMTEVDISNAEALYRRRQESLLAVDELVQKVFNKLLSTHKLDNTYIIFTSDNGFSLGSHRWVGKQYPYEEMARVPLMIVGPGIPMGEVRNQLVTTLDVAATIIEWSGALPGNALDGKSLVPLLAPGGETAPWRKTIFIEGRIPGVEPSYHFTAVRSHDAMYGEVEFKGVVEREFYRFSADPRQLLNVVGSTPERILAKWAKLVAQLKKCSGASCD
jgi:arylsulfatase A-like enzyme